MKDPDFIDLNALVGPKERELFVNGLQALHRERLAAFHVASRLCFGTQRVPDRQQFGLEEVAALLKRVGSCPSAG